MWLVLVLAACRGGDDSQQADTNAAAELTYYKDVKPILEQHCTRCHTDGGVGPVSFDDPDTVVSMAARIAERTAAGEMPPPAPDPDCQPYENSDRLYMTDEARQVLADWAEAGAPLGEEAEAADPVPPLSLAPFDVELYPSQPIAPDFPADRNLYWCAALPSLGDVDKFITGLEVIPDNTQILHHVVLFHDTTGSFADAPAEGRACSVFGDTGFEFMYAWGPGGTPLSFPDGVGMRVPANASLVIQMHYYDSGDPNPDQTGVGVKLADAVDSEVRLDILGPVTFNIPAGESAWQESDKWRYRSELGDYRILAVWPHMHLLGTQFDMGITHDDGSETCLVDLDGYNFHDQVTLQYETPVPFADGDSIKVTCTWDNSADNPYQVNDPPQDVGWGEDSEDEMCFAFTYGYTVP